MITGRAVVVGQGYVGLPVAMRAVHGGYDVVGFEVDPAKVDALNEGRSHVEDITAEMLRTALDTGRYRASADPADLAGFEVAVTSAPLVTAPMMTASSSAPTRTAAPRRVSRFWRPVSAVRR